MSYNPPVDTLKYKILFILYNLVLWASGLVLLWYGVWLEVEFSRYIRLDFASLLTFGLIAVGSLEILFTCIACFCTLKGNSSAHSLLHPFGLVLGVLFVLELLLSVSMVWLKQKLMAKFNDLQRHGDSSVFTSSDIDMHLIQTSLKCCGFTGPGDWVKAGRTVSSCCTFDNCDPGKLSNLFTKGCVGEMEKFVDSNIGAMSLLLLVFGVISLAGVFCSFSWARKYSVSSYEEIGN